MLFRSGGEEYLGATRMICAVVAARRGWPLAIGARGDTAKVSRSNDKGWVGATFYPVDRAVP